MRAGGWGAKRRFPFRQHHEIAPIRRGNFAAIKMKNASSDDAVAHKNIAANNQLHMLAAWEKFDLP